MMENTILTITDAGFYYQPQQWIFRHLNFSLKKGQRLALLGLNGQGKTTLLQSLIENIHLKEGQLIKGGETGFVPQFFTPPFPYSVLDIVLMGRARKLGLFQLPKAYDKEIAMSALEQLALTALAHKSFNDLSGGQRQMVLIARALATQCQLLIMDEPASALDLYHQSKIFSLIEQMSEQHQLSVIFSTHQPNHALAAADKALILFPQQDYIYGKPSEVMSESHLQRLYSLPMLRCHHIYHQQHIESVTPVYALKRE